MSLDWSSHTLGLWKLIGAQAAHRILFYSSSIAIQTTSHTHKRPSAADNKSAAFNGAHIFFLFLIFWWCILSNCNLCIYFDCNLWIYLNISFSCRLESHKIEAHRNGVCVSNKSNGNHDDIWWSILIHLLRRFCFVIGLPRFVVGRIWGKERFIGI